MCSVIVHGVSTRQPGEAASRTKFLPERREDAGLSATGGAVVAVAAVVVVTPFALAAGFAGADADAEAGADADADAEGATGVPVMAIVGASVGTATALAVGAVEVSGFEHAARRVTRSAAACSLHIVMASSSDRSP
jgi:hypothetical protein